MPDTSNVKAIVLLVARALLRHESESAVVEKLIVAGVPPAEAPALFRAIKTACQQGVQAVITEGLSAPGGPPDDPLLAEAFRVGQACIRGEIRAVWLWRVLKLVIVAAVVVALVWFFRR